MKEIRKRGVLAWEGGGGWTQATARFKQIRPRNFLPQDSAKGSYIIRRTGANNKGQ